jgi:dTDP-4-amino-4,6-dideoxygalactose transaminase
MNTIPFLRIETATDFDTKNICWNWLSNFGPRSSLLENKLESYLGKHCCLCANATIGLYALCKILGVKKLEIPSLTFPATAFAAQMAGAKVIFGAVDRKTGYLVPSIKESCVVKVYGSNCQQPALFYDSAGSIGNFSFDETTEIYSLHATKVLGCGEGGLLATSDANLKKEFISFINFGRVGMNFTHFGINGKMSEVNAELGLANFQLLPDIVDKRRSIAKRYYQKLKDLPISLFEWQKLDECFQLYPIRFASAASCDKFIEHMKAHNVECKKYYDLLHKIEDLKNCTVHDDCKDLDGTICCIPLYSKLSVTEVEYILQMIEGYPQ